MSQRGVMALNKLTDKVSGSVSPAVTLLFAAGNPENVELPVA